MKYRYISIMPVLISAFLVTGCGFTQIKEETSIQGLSGETKTKRPNEIKTNNDLTKLANQHLSGLKAETVKGIINLPDEQIDLATAIFLISRNDYRNLFNPYVYVDKDKYTEIVDEIALVLLNKIGEKSEPKLIINTINKYISKYFSIMPGEEDPRLQFLNFVLDEKKGGSIGLSLLYLSIAERIGLKLYGVNAYDKIFVRYEDSNETINVDVQHIDEFLGDSFYREESNVSVSDKFFLQNMGKREIISSFIDFISSLYVSKRWFDDAISNSNLSLEISPQFFTAYNTRGIAYREKGEVDKAIDDFTKTIEINPVYANAYYNRGIVYREKGE
ncbi:MAG: tetratricopeptide repeat protein, partial [Deltaproteobacteria bacterium]|nr:tetratricopeptide repeat protein [Deltaproteobacteria bacterium]